MNSYEAIELLIYVFKKLHEKIDNLAKEQTLPPGYTLPKCILPYHEAWWKFIGLSMGEFPGSMPTLLDIAKVTKQQDKQIFDLQARLRELDEKNQTQAQVLAARDRIIERQERMIGMACEWLQKIGCPVLDNHYCDENCSTEMNGSECWRRWLEQEAWK